MSILGISSKFSNFFIVFILVACSAVSGATLADEPDFKTFDMMGFEFVPSQHSDKGLEKVPVLYQCAMFKTDFARGVNNCNGMDYSEPDEFVIKERAAQYSDAPFVAIDIEGGVWNLHSQDLTVVAGAVRRWQDLIRIWQEVNPDTTILIFGGMPRAYWALLTNNLELMDLYEQQTQIIAALFSNEKVALWPSAYVVSDMPDVFRADRKWQIDVCHNVYKTKCYFAITPQFIGYVDSGTLFRLHMDQNSFLELMTSLKEDGADGFGLWINPRDLPADYEFRRKVWSWAGGAAGRKYDKDLMWMSALEKFLDTNSQSQPPAINCVDSILAAAAYSCPAEVSRRLGDWGWLDRYK